MQNRTGSGAPAAVAREERWIRACMDPAPKKLLTEKEEADSEVRCVVAQRVPRAKRRLLTAGQEPSAWVRRFLARTCPLEKLRLLSAQEEPDAGIRRSITLRVGVVESLLTVEEEPNEGNRALLALRLHPCAAGEIARTGDTSPVVREILVLRGLLL